MFFKTKDFSISVSSQWAVDWDSRLMQQIAYNIENFYQFSRTEL